MILYDINRKNTPREDLHAINKTFNEDLQSGCSEEEPHSYDTFLKREYPSGM